MLDTKQGHPKAGASCAWVPSPTAATLHAIHYHQIDVAARQREIAKQGGATEVLLDGILTPPLLTRTLTPQEIQSFFRVHTSLLKVSNGHASWV